MAQQLLNVGTNSNDGTGDTLRVAMQKVNENFTEVYTSPGISTDAIGISGNQISAVRSNDDLVFAPAGTGSITMPALRFNDNNIEGIRSNENINLIPAGTGSVVFGAIKISGTSLSSDDSSFININDNLIVSDTATIEGSTLLKGNVNLEAELDVAGNTTLANITASGTASLAGTVTIDNLTFNDNIIGSTSNADINLTPGGTGTVVISNLKIDDNIQITDNAITTTVSNSNLELEPSGTGSVVIQKADINGGNIDNTVIGSSTAVAGTFTTVTANTSAVIDGVTIIDNTISTNASNADLELSANGSGKVDISGFKMPTTDGSVGQFITTNGSGVLSFATAGATLSHSTISDGTTTVTSSAVTEITNFNKSNIRSAKYFISITDTANTKFELVEANVTHDGTNAYISTFGSTSNFTPDGSSTTVTPVTFSADIDGSNVRLLAQCASADSTVFKFQGVIINV